MFSAQKLCHVTERSSGAYLVIHNAAELVNFVIRIEAGERIVEAVGPLDANLVDAVDFVEKVVDELAERRQLEFLTLKQVLVLKQRLRERSEQHNDQRSTAPGISHSISPRPPRPSSPFVRPTSLGCVFDNHAWSSAGFGQSLHDARTSEPSPRDPEDETETIE